MKKMFKNFLYNLSGNLLSKLLSFIVIAFIAREYGSEIFGEFNIVKAEFSYFEMIALMGLDSYGLFLMTKAENIEKKISVFRDIFTVKTIMGIVVSFLLVIYSFSFSGIHSYIILLLPLLLFQSIDCIWALNSLQDMKFSAYKGLITSLGFALFVAIFYYIGLRKVEYLLVSFVIPIIIYNLFTLQKLYKKYNISVKFSKPLIFEYIKNGFPFMVSGVFAGINMNIDIVIMGYTIQKSQIGYYSADYKIITEFIVLCGVLFTPFYPMFIEKLRNQESDYVNKILGYLKTFIICAILPCVIGGLVYGGEVLKIFFGEEYIQGETALSILMIYVFVFYCREIYGYTLTAAGKQFAYMRIVGLSALINITLNIFFIPIYGINAAAITTLISEIVNFIFMRLISIRKIGIKPKKYRINKVIVPITCFALCCLLSKYYRFNGIISLLVSCLVYVLLIVIFRVFDKNLLIKILRKDI